jgi:hypothetical protein
MTSVLSVHCPRHGTEVLLSERRITRIARDGDHLTLEWVCWCGHRGTHRTGRPAPRPTIV